VKQWLVYLKVYYPQAGALFAKVKRVTDPNAMATALSESHWAQAA
jgi:tRNA-dihydrouridine synthase C